MTRPSPRKPATLSDSLHQQLNKYALAAVAAGVGALALAQPAEARIIYTSAHKKLPRGNSYLDLNHDGINDFRFRLWAAIATGSRSDYLTVQPVGQGNETWFSTPQSAICAYPVKRGSQIGPLLGRFGGGKHYMFLIDTGGLFCGWNQMPTRAYLGLKFVIKGKDHYGWARFVTDFHLVTATLTGYAYETIPNKPIIAGATKGPDVITVQPVSLGRLALGRK
jgi:hypothetical protein